MGWKSFVKRKVKKAAKRATNVGGGLVGAAAKRGKRLARAAARRAEGAARKHGRKVLEKAVVAGAAGTATYFGGPAAGLFAAKVTNKVVS